MWQQRTQRLRDKTIIRVYFFIVPGNLSYVMYFTSHVICCTPATATSLRQYNNMFVGSLTGGVWRLVESMRFCDRAYL